MLGANELDENAAQGGDGDIDEIADGQPCRLEIDADHGSDFEINEQEQDVRQAGVPLRHHFGKSRDCGPHRGRPDGEQRQVMKPVDQQGAKSIGERLHARVNIVSGLSDPAYRLGH